jgi:hypothetical protein
MSMSSRIGHFACVDISKRLFSALFRYGSYWRHDHRAHWVLHIENRANKWRHTYRSGRKRV